MSELANDLNQYELQRLENIRRNEAFLANLGLGSIKLGTIQKAQVDAKSDDCLIERKRKISTLEASNTKPKEGVGQPLQSRRRSGRLSDIGGVTTSTRRVHAELCRHAPGTAQGF